MIDTHTHLYLADSFPDGGEAAVAHALDEDVNMMVLPGIDREAVDPMLRLHSLYPKNTAVALGLHPTEAGTDWKDELNEILERGGDSIDPVAIGETGIDLHWDRRYLTRQMDAFGEQIQIALDKNLPVIVHSRDAVDATVEVIRSFGGRLPGIVFHSFTYGRPEAERLLEFAPDAFFGINGVITFKNAKDLREAVIAMDLSRIVTETDSPFLAPVPHRGETNESANIKHIVRAISEIKGVGEEELKDITVKNAIRLFPKLKAGFNQTS